VFVLLPLQPTTPKFITQRYQALFDLIRASRLRASLLWLDIVSLESRSSLVLFLGCAASRLLIASCPSNAC